MKIYVFNQFVQFYFLQLNIHFICDLGKMFAVFY